MILLSIDSVKENMRLAKTIYAADENILLAEGMKLTNNYIQRLKEMGISILYIADNRIGKITVDEIVKVQIRTESIKVMREVLTNVRNGKTVNSEKVRQVVNNLLEELIANRNAVYNLVEIRSLEDHNFVHSVSVSVLAIMTGIALGYNYLKLKQLGTGAILHDIGKTGIPRGIMNKTGKLTPEEYEIVKKHSQIGYDLLRKCNDITSVSAHAVWQHHERMDGSGYPRGLKGGEIHEFARIVALADTYDALSSDRCYRKRLWPHEAIEFIRDKCKTLFDPDIVAVFLQNIAPFPVGSMVELNNGEVGVVVKVAKDFPARPMVKVLYKDGALLPNPVDLDLKKDLTHTVVAVCKNFNEPG